MKWALVPVLVTCGCTGSDDRLGSGAVDSDGDRGACADASRGSCDIEPPPPADAGAAVVDAASFHADAGPPGDDSPRLPPDAPLPAIGDPSPCVDAARVVVMAEAPDLAQAVAVTDDHVLFSTEDHGTSLAIRGYALGSPGAIYRRALCGGDIEVVSTHLGNYRSLVDTKDSIYFTRTHYQYAVGRIDKAEDRLTILMDGLPHDTHIAVDATHAYFSGLRAIYRVAHGSTDVEEIPADGNLTGRFSLDGQRLLWTDRAGAHQSLVDGSQSQLLDTGAFEFWAIAGWGGGVAFGGRPFDGTMQTGIFALADGQPPRLVAPSSDVLELRVRDPHAWWRSGTGLHRVALDGSSEAERVAPHGSPYAVADRAYASAGSFVLGWALDPLPEPVAPPWAPEVFDWQTEATFRRVLATDSGDVIVSGVGRGSVLLGGASLELGEGDTAFVAKLDSAGALLWHFVEGPTGSAGPSGAMCLARGPADAVVVGTEVQEGQSVLRWLDPDGGPVWATELTSPVVSCDVDASGAVYVQTGRAGASATEVVRFSSSGTEVWRTSLSTGVDDAFAGRVIADGTGVVCVTTGHLNSFVRHLDDAGAVDWELPVREASVTDIARAPDDGWVLMGETQGYVTLNAERMRSPAPGFASTFLGRITAQRTTQWVSWLAGVTAARHSSGTTGLVVDASGEILLRADVVGNALIDLGGSAPDRHPSTSFIARFSPAGERLATWGIATQTSSLALSGDTLLQVADGHVRGSLP